MKTYSVVGKRKPKVDSYEKVTGEARYSGDLSLPGMLYGKILRSPYPHARILTIDTNKAKRLTGVKAVITGEDTLKVKHNVFCAIPEFMDEYLLAVDKVRFIGDEVAAVAALDEDTAEEALELIQVEYEELPAVFDPIEAMEPAAPNIHERDSNISCELHWNLGEIEKGFEDSHHIREDSFYTPVVCHATIENHASLASFDSSGRVILWPSSQTPLRLRYGLARTLGMPEGNIRLIIPYLGSGFGGKAELLALDFCTCFLSKITGRAVKLVYTKEEVFTSTRRRHPMLISVKTGVKGDGTLMAMESKVILDGGAYNSFGPVTTYLAGAFSVPPYRLPNYRFHGYHVYTNKPVCGAQRGHGAIQPRFAIESQLDMIAEDLGMDPLKIRSRNRLRAGEVTINKMKITSCGLEECIKRSVEKSRWKERHGRLTPNRGLGMGCSIFVSGAAFPITPSNHAFSNASIEVHDDGTATLLSGTVDIGQGSKSILSQIAAEELGIPLEKIRIITADTEICPPDQGSFSSRVTLMAGNAVKSATVEAKRKILEAAAERLEANVDDLDQEDGQIFVKGSTEKGISLSEAVVTYMAMRKGEALVGKGMYSPEPDPDANLLTGEINASPAYCFGAQTAEVEVDIEIGRVKVLKVIPAQDCGFAINPMSVEGQIEGAVYMAIGQTLYEEVIQEKGRVLNPNFLDYRLPTALDVPKIETSIVETIDPAGPFGAKETSEGSILPTAPAIANAIYDAVGIRIKELPITPEKILKALELSVYSYND